MHYKTFKTDRLLLRPTSEEDANLIYQLLNTPKWLQYIGDRNIRSLEDAKAYIQNKMTPQLKRLGYGNYTVIRKEDQAKMGTCGIYDREGVKGVDIGFAFLPEFEKKGFAYEAAFKLMNVFFSEFGIHRIQAYTSKKNQASQKLLEKLGLKQTGTTFLPDDKEELLVYRISNTKE
ncbi:GNAT family N-acetyltransferase [Marixanthomonas spongiae]|uniref:GNAT family N-acetyltransferase n=1 Tax=Marixanthomonas spongiae TaxID=2174845 RepID=A0A2U0HWD1_9FLAO|nr:GNAT family N-acetyltransferase [Marixanthomonas spongiae]PVW13181.1 GNAT family N-acetyltransferase [Marixanthomonas spongiae]